MFYFPYVYTYINTRMKVTNGIYASGAAELLGEVDGTLIRSFILGLTCSSLFGLTLVWFGVGLVFWSIMVLVW